MARKQNNHFFRYSSVSLYIYTLAIVYYHYDYYYIIYYHRHFVFSIYHFSLLLYSFADVEEVANEKSRQIHHPGRLARFASHYVASGRSLTAEARRK